MMTKDMDSLAQRFVRFADSTLSPLWNLLARIYLFIVFYKSAILKVKDLVSGRADVVIFLFEYEYKLPMPNLVGPLASFAELICAFLVLIGLFSRLSAFLLLCMAIFIQFWYVYHVSHILWMFLASYVVIHGGGRLSVDSIWCHTIGSNMYKNSKDGAMQKNQGQGTKGASVSLRSEDAKYNTAAPKKTAAKKRATTARKKATSTKSKKK